jgi:hypothetical protein
MMSKSRFSYWITTLTTRCELLALFMITLYSIVQMCTYVVEQHHIIHVSWQWTIILAKQEKCIE